MLPNNLIPVSLSPNCIAVLVVLIVPASPIEVAVLDCAVATKPPVNVNTSAVPARVPSVNVPVLANVVALVIVAFSNIAMSKSWAATVRVAVVKSPPATLPNIISSPASVSVKTTETEVFTALSKVAPPEFVIVSVVIPVIDSADVIRALAPVPAFNVKVSFPPVPTIAPSKFIKLLDVAIEVFSANVIPLAEVPNCTTALLVIISPARVTESAPSFCATATKPPVNVKSSAAPSPRSKVPVLANVTELVMLAFAFIWILYAWAWVVRVAVVKAPANITVSSVAFPLALSISVKTTDVTVVTAASKVTPPASVIVSISIALTIPSNSVLAEPESIVRFWAPLAPVTAAPNVIISVPESNTVVLVPVILNIPS